MSWALEGDIRNAIAEQECVEPESIDVHENLCAQLGMDSLSELAMVAMIENRFDVTIPDARLEDLKSVEGIADVLESLGVVPTGWDMRIEELAS